MEGLLAALWATVYRLLFSSVLEQPFVFLHGAHASQLQLVECAHMRTVDLTWLNNVVVLQPHQVCACQYKNARLAWQDAKIVHLVVYSSCMEDNACMISFCASVVPRAPARIRHLVRLVSTCMRTDCTVRAQFIVARLILCSEYPCKCLFIQVLDTCLVLEPHLMHRS